MGSHYVEVGEDEIPKRVRFDVPRRNQGQIVEVAYGGFGRAEMDSCDPYRRITDTSLPLSHPRRVVYERRVTT